MMKTPIAVGPALVAAMKLCYHSDRPVLVRGHAGVGKSESFEQLASELNIECIVRDLSIMEAPDLGGFPVVKNGYLDFAPPRFLPTKGKGLLVFEELNRCPRALRAPCLQLLTTRRLNDHQLPKEWLPCACINPDDEDYAVDVLDPALLSRFTVIDVKPDVTNWVSWAQRTGVHEAVISFVQATPKIFDRRESNPRAWKYVSDLIKAGEEHQADAASVLCAVEGTVGSGIAVPFLNFYHSSKKTRVPSAADLINRYGKFEAQIKTWVRAGNTAVLNSICEQMLLYLQNPTHEHAVKNSSLKATNAQKLWRSLPAEYRSRLERSHRWLRASA